MNKITENQCLSIQFYIFTSLLLVLTSSFLSIDAIGIKAFSMVMFLMFILTGFYSFFVVISGRHEVAALLSCVILILLPLVQKISFLIFILAAIGHFFLFRKKVIVKNNYKKVFVVAGVLIFFILGGHFYTSFQYQNQLVSNLLHKDTLFHASIANMYKNYGIVSVGLDGLVPINYHVLSHKIIAGLSVLSGLSTLEIYSYIFTSIAPLLLIFSLAGLSYRINPKNDLYTIFVILTLIFLIIRFIPVFRWAALWESYLTSESYLVALIFLASSLSALYHWIEDKKYFNLILSLTLLVFSGMAKGSVGIVGICVFIFLGATKFRQAIYWIILFVFSVILYFFVIDMASSAKNSMPINLFHFVKTYVRGSSLLSIYGLLTYFLFIHFLPVWWCFFNGFKKERILYIKNLEFQILLSLFIPSVIIALTFQIAGGSAFYFSSIPTIFAIVFISNHHSEWINKHLKHLIIIFFFFSPLSLGIIYNNSFFKGMRDEWPKIEGLQSIIEELQEIKNVLPQDIIVTLENQEVLIDIMGCKAYWFLPAIIERPMAGALPDGIKCPNDGYYGLSEYTTDNSTYKTMQLTSLRLKNMQ